MFIKKKKNTLRFVLWPACENNDGSDVHKEEEEHTQVCVVAGIDLWLGFLIETEYWFNKNEGTRNVQCFYFESLLFWCNAKRHLDKKMRSEFLLPRHRVHVDSFTLVVGVCCMRPKETCTYIT